MAWGVARTPRDPARCCAMTSVRSLDDLLAVVPYLLGFHPADSIVTLGARDVRIVFQVRVDLPPPAEAARFAVRHADLVAQQRVTSVILLGYGTEDQVSSVVRALRAAFAARAIAVLDALRVGHDRYWSYLCEEPGCCPADGRPYDPVSHPLAVAAVVAGRVALPSRGAFAARLAPVTGPARLAMDAATTRAYERLARLLDPAGGDTPGDPGRHDPTGGSNTAGPDPGRAVQAPGAAAVDDALSRQRAGIRLTDDEVAWLCVALAHLSVRDHAWRRAGDDLDLQVALWSDVLRRADPRLAAAPGTLLALAAWQAGEGSLASIALDRALSAAPTYELALLLRQALDNGLSPETIRSGRV